MKLVNMNLHWSVSFDLKIIKLVIYCQHVFFQMLHKDCPMHLLQFLHVLHDVTKNQQHLWKLFHNPICPHSWTNIIQECLFQEQSLQIQFLITIILLRWSLTNLFHAKEIPFSSSMYKSYCPSTFSIFQASKWMSWLWIKHC